MKMQQFTACDRKAIINKICQQVDKLREFIGFFGYTSMGLDDGLEFRVC